MNAQLKAGTVNGNAVLREWLCAACVGGELDLCHLPTANGGAARPKPHAVQQAIQTIPARRIVCREQDLNDAVPVICDGWAASVVSLSDSSRQILSFLLPGDIVSTALLFEPRAYCFVEAITEVRYCAFKRSELKAILFKQPDLFEKLARSLVEEKTRADQLVIDLGRRTAEERIARLMLNLMNRLARRGMAQDQTIDFPLRQHHIADATGLTPVHVNKVLSEFRRNGLIKLSDRSLTVLDPVGFRRVSAMR
jgi:CRP/FNR family transcriptional regulator, anaerobic regulatory protein